MRFAKEQVEEIEDRVNNLIQAASTVLVLISTGVEVDSSDIRRARVDLKHLARWTQTLHPISDHRNPSPHAITYDPCQRCGEEVDLDASGKRRCMYCGYVTPERRRY